MQPISNSNDFVKYFIIDGQQRLITIYLIFKTLYDKCCELNEKTQE